ncbi:MAG: alcohol dehydrogenase catalytic domain-containing protein, partial [Nevskiaceae bacterium]
MDRRDFLTVASATAAGSASLSAVEAEAASGSAQRSGRPGARERSRVWRIGTPPSIDNLQLTTRDTPLPQRGEVLVRVVATSINARDRGIVAGFFPIGANKASIPLSEGAGEVIAVGEGVDEVAVGDRVKSSHFPDSTEGRWRPSVSERDKGNTLDGWLGER